MLGGPPMHCILRHDQGSDCPQTLYNVSRVVESTHLRVASGQKSICGRPARVLLQRPQQHRYRVSKSLNEKVAYADPHESVSPEVCAEPQRGLKMVDRDFRCPYPQPKPAAPIPAMSEAGVQCQCMID